MEIYKVDGRKRKNIQLKGTNVYTLPFDDLENYTDEKIENLGNLYSLDFSLTSAYRKHFERFNTYVYKLDNKLYIIDTIKHDNTTLLSAKLYEIEKKYKNR